MHSYQRPVSYEDPPMGQDEDYCPECGAELMPELREVGWDSLDRIIWKSVAKCDDCGYEREIRNV